MKTAIILLLLVVLLLTACSNSQQSVTIEQNLTNPIIGQEILKTDDSQVIYSGRAYFGSYIFTVLTDWNEDSQSSWFFEVYPGCEVILEGHTYKFSDVDGLNFIKER